MSCPHCLNTGVELIEGPCDAAPLEAPCRCLTSPTAQPPAKLVSGSHGPLGLIGEW